MAALGGSTSLLWFGQAILGAGAGMAKLFKKGMV